MKSKTLSAIGGWHSFLFCIGMYVVALFFSIFVCSSIFYAMNSRPSGKDAAFVVKSADKATTLASLSR
jgi:hypothetical protein